MSKRLNMRIIKYCSLVDRDEDEILENNELQPVLKRKQQQRTTWSKKRPDNTNNYHYALPKVSMIL